MNTKLLLMHVIMILAINSALCQSEIPRKVDKIVVVNNYTAKENYLLTKRLLADQSIEISNQDTDIFQIKTGIIPVKKSNAESYYVITAKDSSIIIKGNAKSGIMFTLYGVTSTDNFEAIRNIGMKGSPYNRIFNTMNDFALSYKLPIRYELSH